MDQKENSGLRLDEQVIRLIAAQVFILASLTLYFQWVFLALLLTVDFALRAFTKQPSPLAAVAKIIAAAFKLKPVSIFAPPKKFAASLGFIFSLSILFFLIVKLYTVSYWVGGVLLVCAFLESVFKLCVGCYAYNWFVAPLLNKRGAGLYVKINERRNMDRK